MKEENNFSIIDFLLAVFLPLAILFLAEVGLKDTSGEEPGDKTGEQVEAKRAYPLK